MNPQITNKKFVKCDFDVLVAPKIAPFHFGDDPSNFGDSASIQCLVTSGDFPIDFKWLYNGRPVSEVFGISTVKLGKRTYALTIDSVNGKHAGNYTCEASNSAGVDRYNATLIVNGTKKKSSLQIFIFCVETKL